MKVLITQDFLTTSAGLGYFQVKSLSSILKVLQAIPSVLIDARPLHRSYFLRHVGINDNDEKYIFEVNDSHLKDLKDPIEATLRDYDLVIGYEFTEITRRALAESDIFYIDLWVTSIRFYRDVFFELHSNCPRATEILAEHKLPDSLLYKRAEEIKNYSINFLPKANIEDHSLLVITQLAEDKSVVRNGDFLSLKQYFNDIKDLSKDYGHTYFLKHPKQSSQEFFSIFEQFENLPHCSVLSNTSIYSILSANQLKSVTAISSSVLSECRYFKKEAIYLHKPVIPEHYVKIYEAVYSCSFWERILDTGVGDSSRALIVQDNDFRISKNAVYGFKDYLNYDPVQYFSYLHHKSLVQLLTFLNELNAGSTPVVIYGYGTLGKIVAPLLKNLRAIFDESAQGMPSLGGINVLYPSSENLRVFHDSVFIVTPYHNFDEIIANTLDGFQAINLGVIMGTFEA